MKIIYIIEDCLVRGEHKEGGDIVEVSDSEAMGILESGRGSLTPPAKLNSKAKAAAEAAAKAKAEAEAKAKADAEARKDALDRFNADPELQAQFEGDAAAYLAALQREQ